MNDLPQQELMIRLVQEASEKRAAMLETYLTAYLIANPGLTINDMVLVEQNKGDRIVWYFASKADAGV